MRGRRRRWHRCGEDGDRLEHRPRGLRHAVGPPIEDPDPDPVVIPRFNPMPAQLEVDRLLLVAYPLVGSNFLEAGEDQPVWRRPARPPARSSRPSPRTAEREDPGATDPAPRSCGPPGYGAARSDHRAPRGPGASRPRPRGRAGAPLPPRHRWSDGGSVGADQARVNAVAVATGSRVWPVGK